MRAENKGEVGCFFVSTVSSEKGPSGNGQEEGEHKHSCMPPSQYRGVILLKLPEKR